MIRRALVGSVGAPIVLLASACTEPDPNVVVRVEIRHLDGSRITRADSIPWYGGFFLSAVALNGRGDPIPDQEVTWTATGAISHDPFGRFHFRALGVGTGSITATIQDKTAQVTLKTFLWESESFWPWPDTSRMLVGTNRTLVVREVEKGAPVQPGGDLRWETSNTTVATVDQEGNVATVGEGRATITAVVGSRRFPAEVFTFRYQTPLRFASVMIASGYSHLGNTDRACGVTTEGSLYCWGLGYALGLGSEEPSDRCMRTTVSANRFLGRIVGRCSMVPIPVRPDVRFESVHGAQYRICALSEDAIAYCWAPQTYSLVNFQLPTPLDGNLRFQSIDVGVGRISTSSACGVTTAGAAYCWGDNDFGQLGNGSTTDSEAPVSVAGGLTFQSVRAGATACGVASDGGAYCWGANDAAQAGAAVGSDTKNPVRVAGQHRFVQVEPAGSITCGLVDTGSVYCWGGVGGSATPSPTPVPLSGDHRFERLAEHTSCGVTPEGAVYCWDATLVPSAVSLPFPARTYGHMNGSAPGFSGSIQYALGRDGLLYWWDGRAGSDPYNFFFYSAGYTAGLRVGSTTPVLVPGQQ